MNEPNQISEGDLGMETTVDALVDGGGDAPNTVEGPKRGRRGGRYSKVVDDARKEMEAKEAAGPESAPAPKKRGRPRKHPLPSEVSELELQPEPKKKRGRPRKHPLPQLEAEPGLEPRRRGRRPKTVAQQSEPTVAAVLPQNAQDIFIVEGDAGRQSQAHTQAQPRPKGRPRKHPKLEAEVPPMVIIETGINPQAKTYPEDVGRYAVNAEDITKRLNRVQGQVRGIQHMVERGVYCDEILTQILSVQSAISSVAKILLELHITGAVVPKLKADDQEIMEEFLTTLGRLP